MVFLSGIDFLGYQLQLQQGLVISGNTHARDVPLRSCVPVFHLLPYLNPITCMFFFLPKNLNPVFPVLSTILHNLHFCFLLCPHKQAPNSLPCPPGLYFCCIFLVLFLNVGPEVLEQVLKVEQVSTESPLEKGASAEMLCGHPKPLPGWQHSCAVIWQTAGVRTQPQQWDFSLSYWIAHFWMCASFRYGI